MDIDDAARAAERAAGAARKRKVSEEVRRNGGTRIAFNAPRDVVAIIDSVKRDQRYQSRDAALIAIVTAYSRMICNEQKEKSKA